MFKISKMFGKKKNKDDSTSKKQKDQQDLKMDAPKGLKSIGMTSRGKRHVPLKKGIIGEQCPEDRGKLTVVLDMDETLLHSQFESGNEYRQEEERQEAKSKADFTVTLGGADTVHVHKRPGVDKFLRKVAEDFELIVFTAALPVYAKPVMDVLDPDNLIKFRLYRESTVTYKGQPYVKDLSMMGRDMRRIVIVDNNPLAMLARPDNAIPIISFYDDPADEELEKTLRFLYELKDVPDVRPFLKKRFRFRENLKHMLYGY